MAEIRAVLAERAISCENGCFRAYCSLCLGTLVEYQALDSDIQNRKFGYPIRPQGKSPDPLYYAKNIIQNERNACFDKFVK